MKISTYNILTSDSLKVVEHSIANTELWFTDDRKSFGQDAEFAALSMVLGDKKVEFTVDVAIDATCRTKNSGGDGRITPDFDDVENVKVAITITNPFSEDADIDFDLNDKEVSARIV